MLWSFKLCLELRKVSCSQVSREDFYTQLQALAGRSLVKIFEKVVPAGPRWRPDWTGRLLVPPDTSQK